MKQNNTPSTKISYFKRAETVLINMTKQLQEISESLVKFSNPITQKVKREIELQVIAYIPGTLLYKKRIGKLIVHELQTGIKEVMSLTSISNSEKISSYKNLRYIEKVRSRNVVLTERKNHYSQLIDFCLMCFLVYLIPILLIVITCQSCGEMSPKNIAGLIILSLGTVFVSLVAAMIIVLVITFIIFTALSFSVLLAFTTSVVTLVSLSAFIFFYSDKIQDVISLYTEIEHTISYLIIYQSISIIIYFVVTFYSFVIFLHLRFDRNYRRNYFDVSIYVDLLNLTFELEKNNQHWASDVHKREFLLSLESLYRKFLRRGSRKLLNTDPYTSKWFEEENFGMAQAFRELKKWVLMPKVDTKQELTTRISRSLINVINNNWDNLEKAKGERLSGGLVIYTIGYWLMIGINAFIPYLLIRLMVNESLIQKDLYSYLIVGSVVWAVFSVLFAFDPQINKKSEKINAFSQILRIFGIKT